jgi:hypothetical protein
VTASAIVKPVPAYVKRIATADVARGEVIGGLQIWPTARPSVTLEAGERLTIPLRIRAVAADAGTPKLTADAPETWKLRRDTKSSDYWLDIPIDAAAGSGSRKATINVDAGQGRSLEMHVRLMVNVLAENLVVTPKSIDFGEVTLANARSSMKRVGVRKIVGTFHVKSVSSTLPFLKLEQITIIENSNYLLRITIDPAKPLKPGDYDGVLQIETDGGNRLEVPVKIKLADQ